MIETGVGVSTRDVFELKKIDIDYFSSGPEGSDIS
jgi:restriction endonuclease Mrr